MSNATEWRECSRQAAVSTDLKLPSGMVVKARRPDGLQLAEWQKLPLALAATLGPSGEVLSESFSLDEAVELAASLRELLIYCCLQPRISLDPKNDDEIHPREIPSDDWRYIVHWALRLEEGQKLAPFRGERSGTGAGGDGADVGGSSVESARDRGPGFSTEF
jgi:hypothetical protein